MKSNLSRRAALKTIAGTAAALAAFRNVLEAAAELKGNVRHSVCKWCYKNISLEDMCKAAQAIGIEAIDLLEVKDLPVLKEHGLVCAMVSGVPGGIPKGLNRPENHDGSSTMSRRYSRRSLRPQRDLFFGKSRGATSRG